jgi:hypothetical protein
MDWGAWLKQWSTYFASRKLEFKTAVALIHFKVLRRLRQEDCLSSGI